MDAVTDDAKFVAEREEKTEAGDWLWPPLVGAARNQAFGSNYKMVTLNHLPSRCLPPSGIRHFEL